MSASPGRRLWYVIQCKSREDGRALAHLERQKFSCFAPRLKVEKLRQGRKLAIEEPLFPGYLFVHLDETGDNWHRIRSTRGVLQLVHFNDRLMPIDDRIIERIRERLAVPNAFVPYLKPGEQVRITDGSFSNLEAIFLANDGSERVVLLLNILNSEQKLSFPVASVRKLRETCAEQAAS